MGKLKIHNDKIDPRTIPVRDPLIRMIINGITKSGVWKDRKKENNRNACRTKKLNSEEY